MGFLVRQVVFSARTCASAAGDLDTGPDTGVVCDPGPVGLWRLQSILTGRDVEVVVRESPDPVATLDEGRRVVLPLADELRDALAQLGSWRRATVAARWARTDEVRAEGMSRAATSKLLDRLVGLGRASRAEGSRLYLWVDVDRAVL